MKKYILEITVFVTGLGIMTFELVGAKVLAAFVGTSILVWTCLIGVILTCLSAGYWWGGRLADKNPDRRHFSLILFGSAVFVGLAGFFKFSVMNFFGKLNDTRMIALLGSLVLFGPGSFLMAAVSPFAARLKIANLKATGETVGNLYAVSTVGSIAGTFLTGLVLFLYFSNTEIILLLALVLLLAAGLNFGSRGLKAKIAVGAVLLAGLIGAPRWDKLFLPTGEIYINSQYSDIMVAPGTDNISETGYGTGRPILKLFTDPLDTESAMFLDSDNGLVFPYEQMFRAVATQFNPGAKKTLIIGGAGYSFPKDFLKNNPAATMDVVEIDPQMTATAKKYFNLTDNPRLNIYQQDGRVFLNQNSNKYDDIFVDAFKTYSIPYQLTTLEAVQEESQALNSGGLVAVNLLSSITGDSGKFLRAEYATYKKVFPQVYVFRVNVPFPDMVQNLVLVAVKSNQPANLTSANQEINGYLSRVWDQPIAVDVPVLTDDFAPVDQYMISVAAGLNKS